MQAEASITQILADIHECTEYLGGSWMNHRGPYERTPKTGPERTTCTGSKSDRSDRRCIVSSFGEVKAGDTKCNR